MKEKKLERGRNLPIPISWWWSDSLDEDDDTLLARRFPNIFSHSLKSWSLPSLTFFCFLFSLKSHFFSFFSSFFFSNLFPLCLSLTVVANRFHRDFLLVVLRVIFLFPFIFSGEKEKRANEKKSERKKEWKLWDFLFPFISITIIFLLWVHHHIFSCFYPSNFSLFFFFLLIPLSLFPCSENFHLVICRKMALLFPTSRTDTFDTRRERKNERGQKICMKLKNYSSVFQFVNPEPSEKARK